MSKRSDLNKRHSAKLAASFIIFTIISFCCSPALIAAEFRIGLISEKADERITEYVAMVEYVAGRMEKSGIKGGQVVVTKDIDEMVMKIKNREIEMFFESAFSTLKIKEMTGSIPAVLIWRKGIREYRTLFFVRKDSPFRTLGDLRGKTIAFQDAKSTSAYALPKAEIIAHGMSAVPKGQEAPADAVGYIFAGKEINQAFWVLQKKTDAGAFNNKDWAALPDNIRSELRIIHETQPVLRYVGSFSPHTSPEIKVAVIQILTGMDKTPEGRKILKKAVNIRKIEKLSDDDMKSLEHAKTILKDIE